MDGQLNAKERELITSAVVRLKPRVALEVGTWLGGGSTLHILRALQTNGGGHLWGIEAFQSIYDRMIANIGSAGAEIASRFTPVFGFSDQVIPRFLANLEPPRTVDFVFLDGGDNPLEQITEFLLLDDSVAVGGVLMSHDAKLRKGKWLIPYLSELDHWKCTLHDVSDEGLLEAVKVASKPSAESARRAAATLAGLKRQPLELLGRILPKPVIVLAIRWMPQSLIRRVFHGRK